MIDYIKSADIYEVVTIMKAYICLCALARDNNYNVLSIKYSFQIPLRSRDDPEPPCCRRLTGLD